MPNETEANGAASQTDANAIAATSPQPALLIGVPLFAVAMLMGVYWLILRIGAL